MKKQCLLLLLILVSCTSKKKDPYFDPIAKNDIALAEPVAGDWLYAHKEKGQTFEQFQSSRHIVPSPEANIVYIRPIGTFDSLQKKQVELVREYLQIFFQLETISLETISNDVVPENKRRIGADGNEQLLAGYILDSILKKDKPNKQIALMGLTEKDLYPQPSWNFVFGLASYRDKVGVTSMYRFQEEEQTQENFNLCLTRLLKTSSHEIGHMFGMHHCIVANCVMNGTNSVPETDEHTIRLCSTCQRKLQSGIQYNNKKRLLELADYFRKNNLKSELNWIQKDIKSIP